MTPDEKRLFLLSSACPELDSFDPAVRRAALERAAAEITAGTLRADPVSGKHNLHCHTFFSYNCFGWSPSHVALAAKLLGLAYVGKVDFDVLNGTDEFFDALRLLNLKGVCGMETRVFVPEYAEAEINSPGECGIAYHMGLGFHSEQIDGSAKAFAADLAARAGKRTRVIVERVNAALKDVTLDFDRDVLPLTPAGNPTERHVCAAYRNQADARLGKDRAMAFWTDALRLSPEQAAKAAQSPVALEGFIRSVLMKSGGPGYVRPSAESFPTLDAMNAFTESCGAVPCAAWLNGFSAGEADPEKLLSFHQRKGLRALAIIPDRNWNLADPVKREKAIANLFAVTDAAAKLGLPVLAGTELNSPGNKLVDDFDRYPLDRLLDRFLSGAKTFCV